LALVARLSSFFPRIEGGTVYLTRYGFRGHRNKIERFAMIAFVLEDRRIMTRMIAKLKIDNLGRVMLPKPVREKLQLSAGDELELESLDDRITLRPVRGTAQLRKKRGVWVFNSGEPLSAATVQETIEQVRRERDDTRAVRSSC